MNKDISDEKRVYKNKKSSEYYYKNKEKIALKNKEYREKNKVERTKKAENYRKNNPELTMYTMIKSRAKLTNIPFNIEVKDIVIPKYCPYLGMKLSQNKQQEANSPSLDRIIPELGYVKNNVQVISSLANRMKNNATKEQLIFFAKKILEMYLTDK